MIVSLATNISTIATLIALAFFAIAAVLLYYALRTKGDITAEFSHGRTVLRLDAKDKAATKRPARLKVRHRK